MQNTRTNELELAESLAALRESMPEEDQGPTFEDGEIIRIKGYYYRVVGIQTDLLTFMPHGPRKDMTGYDPDELYRSRRKGQHE